MTNTREIIMKLKEVRAEKQLSLQDILNLMEQNGDYSSKSTLSRIFADGSEEKHFKYDETIRPIAKVLLDIETIDADDTADEQAVKAILKYKIERIKELESQVRELKDQLAYEKLHYHGKLEKERQKFESIIEFRSDQIAKKDTRIDSLLDMVKKLMEKCENCRFHKENVNK